VEFCERAFLKHSIRGRYLYPAARLLPMIPWAIGMFRSHVLLLAQPR
jgi:hypothetical protein